LSDNFNDQWEEKLRALPTAPPPAELRVKILARLPRRRSIWNRPLAYALCLMFLLAANLGLQHFQEVRLNRLMGDEHSTLLSSKQTPQMLLAYIQDRNQMQNLFTEEMP
jgi:hypothetical protein